MMSCHTGLNSNGRGMLLRGTKTSDVSHRGKGIRARGTRTLVVMFVSAAGYRICCLPIEHDGVAAETALARARKTVDAEKSMSADVKGRVRDELK
jgi:hypothetical protein